MNVNKLAWYALVLTFSQGLDQNALRASEKLKLRMHVYAAKLQVEYFVKVSPWLLWAMHIQPLGILIKNAN